MERNVTFGERLKQVMLERRLSYAELGRLLDMNEQTLNRYVLGTREPKISVSNHIAARLKADLYWLQGAQRPDHFEYASSVARRVNTGQMKKIKQVPVLGVIAAGAPVLATEEIEEYRAMTLTGDEDHFFLRIKGDSMIHAGINHGDVVLVRRQSYAKDGEIAAVLLDGEEATLKRYRRQGETVLLQPENPLYDTRKLSIRDFSTGKAQILGVAVRLQREL